MQKTPFKLVMRTPQQTREREREEEEKNEENRMAAHTHHDEKAEHSVVEN